MKQNEVQFMRLTMQRVALSFLSASVMLCQLAATACEGCHDDACKTHHKVATKRSCAKGKHVARAATKSTVVSEEHKDSVTAVTNSEKPAEATPGDRETLHKFMGGKKSSYRGYDAIQQVK